MPRGGARPNSGRKPKGDVGVDLLTRAVAKVAGAPTGKGAIVPVGASDLQSRITAASESLLTTIIDRQAELVEAMFTLAKGISVEKIGNDGEASVYQMPPDRQALEFLITMAHGKPTQKQTTIQDTTIHVVHSMERPNPALVQIKQEELETEEESAIEAEYKMQLEDLTDVVPMDADNADPWGVGKPK